MAYYAFLNETNIVTEVITGKDETDTSENWEQFYGSIRGQVCKRTSYNSKNGIHYDDQGKPDGKPAFRKNYAGIGYTYDEVLDAFIPPKPYLSWLLDTTSCNWVAPIPYPDDGRYYVWNETTQSWDLIG